jgi:hypothetical protein
LCFTSYVREVGEGEAVVRGDEVEARERPALERERVGRARRGGSRSADAAARRTRLALAAQVAQPEVAHPVAVAVVPLAEARGKLPVCQPPGPTSHGSAMSLAVESTGSSSIARSSGCSGRVAAVVVAAERRREVETEAVDLQLLGEVPHRVEHESLRRRAAEVERVAASGRVDVPAMRVVAVVGALSMPRNEYVGPWRPSSAVWL